MVLEFLHAFGELFDLQDEFPDGVTLGKFLNLFVLSYVTSYMLIAFLYLFPKVSVIMNHLVVFSCV